MHLKVQVRLFLPTWGLALVQHVIVGTKLNKSVAYLLLCVLSFRIAGQAYNLAQV